VVGIGTTTPSRALDVRGVGNFSGTVYINNGTDLAGLVAGADDWNVTGTQLYPLDLRYSIGINTTSPQSTLHKRGTFNASVVNGSAALLQNGDFKIGI